MRILIRFILLFGVLVTAGCQDDLTIFGVPFGPTSSPAALQQSVAPVRATDTPERIKPTLAILPERIAPSEVITPVTGEVPEQLLNSIVKDLSERISVSLENIVIVQAQAVVWNDGSLGCPQPGVMYIQSLIPGFRVLLEAGDHSYDYHAAETGYFFLCESALPVISPPGNPDS